MLGNIAVGCGDCGQDIAHGKLFFLQQTENTQADGVGYGFKELRYIVNVGCLHDFFYGVFFGGHILEFNITIN